VTLKKLDLKNFRNHPSLSLVFDKSGAFFHGANGSGKTNILEAIHFLAYAKSFRTHDASHTIRHACQEAEITALFDDDLGLEHTISVLIGKKKAV